MRNRYRGLIVWCVLGIKTYCGAEGPAGLAVFRVSRMRSAAIHLQENVCAFYAAFHKEGPKFLDCFMVCFSQSRRLKYMLSWEAV